MATHRFALSSVVVASSFWLAACGVAGVNSSVPLADGQPEPFEGPVVKAVCQEGDEQETGLQGQVSQADRMTGRSMSPYNCNLELVGQFDNYGEGAGWQHAWYEDCSYMGTATGTARDGQRVPKPGQLHPGVAVIDTSDSAAPVDTTYLASISMADPWESLKVNEKRELLADVNAATGGSNGGPEIDVYSIADDCKAPALLSSVAVGTSNGHAGHFADDGMTYYGGPFNDAAGWRAIDLADPAAPALLLQGFPMGTHDVSTNVAGDRLYMAAPATSQGNGLAIIDVSAIQSRQANPAPAVVGEVGWTDGSTAQMTQPITIGGKPYILFVDEGGKGAARLIDISDEKNPFVASKLKLEVHMPENANAVGGDTTGEPVFGYEGHYCTASDGVSDSGTYTVENAAIVACSYFQSGLRVFDVRDPYRPREIAYYIPPAQPGYHAGSYYQLSGNCGTADWPSAHPRIRVDRNEIVFTSQCNGLMVVRFEQPLADLLAHAH
jgi:hypothetical protein